MDEMICLLFVENFMIIVAKVTIWNFDLKMILTEYGWNVLFVIRWKFYENWDKSDDWKFWSEIYFIISKLYIYFQIMIIFLQTIVL